MFACLLAGARYRIAKAKSIRNSGPRCLGQTALLGGDEM
jgi:hypothetical protein